MTAKQAEQLSEQVETAKVEARLKAIRAEQQEASEELTRVAQRVNSVEAGTKAARARVAELVSQTQDLEQQQRRITQNAEAIRSAIFIVNANAGSGDTSDAATQRAVNDALFKLGQQLEQAEGERSRLSLAAESMERTVTELTCVGGSWAQVNVVCSRPPPTLAPLCRRASKSVLEAAIRELQSKVAAGTGAGVPLTGVDGLLASVQVAQADLAAAQRTAVEKERVTTSELAGEETTRAQFYAPTCIRRVIILLYPKLPPTTCSCS
jgi:hypothetical protein